MPTPSKTSKSSKRSQGPLIDHKKNAKKALKAAAVLGLLSISAYFYFTHTPPLLISQCQMHPWKMDFELYKGVLNASEEHGRQGTILLTTEHTELQGLGCLVDGLELRLVEHRGNRAVTRRLKFSEDQVRQMLTSPLHYD